MIKIITYVSIIWILLFSIRLVSVVAPLAVTEQIGLAFSMVEVALFNSRRKD
jgi:hypothetical protein